MNTFPEPNPKKDDLSSPANQAKSTANELTIKEIESWDEHKLLDWIQHELSRPLEPEDATKFSNAKLTGEAFLLLAGDRKTFTDIGLPIGTSIVLANLAAKIVGKKSRCYCLHYTRSQLTTSQRTANKLGLRDHPALPKERV